MFDCVTKLLANYFGLRKHGRRRSIKFATSCQAEYRIGYAKHISE